MDELLREGDPYDDEPQSPHQLHAKVASVETRLKVYASVFGTVLAIMFTTVGIIGREIVDLWKADSREAEQLVNLEARALEQQSMGKELAALRASAATREELKEIATSIETTLRVLQVDVATLREHVLRDGGVHR